MVHYEVEGFYGTQAASLTPTQIGNLPKSIDRISVPQFRIFDEFREFVAANERYFLIDVSVPKILYCSGSSVASLIQHGVSKYLNFLSVRSINVLGSDSALWEVPTTRRAIFQDKNLKLAEKRAIMELFKSALSTSSSEAIRSSAYMGDEKGVGNSLDESTLSKPVVEYLKSLHIERPELVSGLVNGVCMIAQAASKVTTREFYQRLNVFVNSLTVYDDGCPLLVPMYGNSDLPQAFARMAAVGGAVYILNAEEERLLSELKECRSISTEPIDEDRDSQTVVHGVACIKSCPEKPVHPTICVICRSLNEPPTFVLPLPCSESGFGSLSVCPPGHTLIHFVRIAREIEIDQNALLSEMQKFTANETVLFEGVLVQKGVEKGDIFSLDFDFESAKRILNNLLGNEPSESLPLPDPSPTDDEDPI